MSSLKRLLGQHELMMRLCVIEDISINEPLILKTKKLPCLRLYINIASAKSVHKANYGIIFSPQPGPRGPEGAIGTASFFDPKKWPKKVSSRPSTKTVECSYRHEWDEMCKIYQGRCATFSFLKMMNNKFGILILRWKFATFLEIYDAHNYDATIMFSNNNK